MDLKYLLKTLCYCKLPKENQELKCVVGQNLLYITRETVENLINSL
jgi:hypothetical protein